jgi:GTP 3',8-cyclase
MPRTFGRRRHGPAQYQPPERNLTMRSIEFMPLDADRAWTRATVPTAAEMCRRIPACRPLVPVVHERSETARKYRFVDGRGGIGLIAQVSHSSCGCCSRARLTADRRLRACLFSQDGHDLNFLERSGATDREIGDQIHSIVATKQKGHRISKPVFVPRSRTIVSIGG